MSLVKKVQNTIFQQELFERGDKIILAVSGGPDSACMLDIFSHLKEKYALELLIAHVNYGLRGKNSDQDEFFTRDLAEKHNLEIEVLCPKETREFSPKQKNTQNISENYLRDLRYAFFEKLQKKHTFNYIAVAHNADDQVETYLMRAIRGTGLNGLSAMQFKNNAIIRPLLNTPRTEIMTYLKDKKLKFRIDKTNLENNFQRNKIRNKLIPYLEKNFNPSIKKTLFDSSLSISSDYDFILKSTERALTKIKTLSIEKILKLHPALQKQFLRKAIFDIKHDLNSIDYSHIEEILKLMKSNKGKNQVVLLKGLKIKRKGDKLDIAKIN